MPRVTNINRQQRLQDDFQNWMLGEMKRNKVKSCEMAELLGMTKQAFNYHKKTAKFDFKQLLIIFKKLNADDERILQLMKL